MAKLSVKKQDEMVQAEIDKLWEVLADVPEDKMKAAEKLIERVAFMTVTLRILEDDIKRKGPTYKMKQGSQEMYVENPSQKSYNTMINRYTAAYAKLIDMLPRNEGEPDDGFESFVNAK